jgi:L-ascorbate metabolism protein UlaG (beta-lactamase superfamily)
MSIQLTWLGHGTFQIVLADGETIVIDPWIDGNPAYPAGHEITRCDTILVTHGHFDHIHNVRSLAEKFGSTVVAIYEIAAWLGRKGVQNLSGMNKGGTQRVGSVDVTMTQAIHSGGIQEEDGTFVYGGEPAGYVLKFPDGRVAYFAGDTTVFGDMALITELYQPELAFLPIGDWYTMGPREAALACRLLGVPTVIPMHFGTFPALSGTPAKLQELAPATKIWALTPGVSVEW